MVERDVVLGKVAAIERSLGRIHQVRAERDRYPHPGDVDELIVLHLQRAAQAAVDLAAHVVTTEGYGLPSSLAEAFTLLEKNGIIDADLTARMRRMVGFRNIAVHQYEQVDPAVVEAIVSRHLDDLRVFAARVAGRFGVG